MITISRDSQKLKITVQSGILNYEYIFTWNCNDDVYAELLRRQISGKMEEHLRKIREEAYLDGYRDGRGKKAKKTWFKSWW